MSSDIKLKELNIKRGSIKGRLTKFKLYLESISTLENISPVELSKLAMKLSRIETLFIEFDEVQAQIEVLNAENQANELVTRDLIEQDFDHCICLAQEFIRSNSNPPKEVERSGVSSCSHSNGCHHGHVENISYKLPTMNIPQFDGTFHKWLYFKAMYSSLIHENENIKNVHKFHYLCSYLEGEAARILSNLEMTDSNYQQAWSLLCSRYDNERQLISNHLKSLLNIESVRETEKSLRFIIDNVNKNLRALGSLGLPTDKWDVLLVHILSSKLESSTTVKWEEHIRTLPARHTLDDFFTFLRNRAEIIQSVNENKLETKSKHAHQPHSSTSQFRTQSKSFVSTSKETIPNFKSTFECPMCKGAHRIYECTTFKSKSAEDRHSFINNANMCHNCLRPGHKTQACRLPGSCRLCKSRHNTLLHLSNNSISTNNNVNNSVTLSALSTSEILLCTAKVRLSNPQSKETISVRALLDSGSQSSFITEKVKQRLKLPPQPSNVSIVAIGNNSLNLTPERCSLQLHSNTNSFKVSMHCLVLKTITDKLPKISFDTSFLDLSNVELADPNFNESSSIDMLIGSDLFWDLIGSEQQSLGSNKPSLRSSKLGWLIAGPLPIKQTKCQANSVMCNFSLNEENLHHNLSKFWELESVPELHSLSKENPCELHYLANTCREVDGRFSVGIPLKDEVDCLGDSYYTAKKRFFNLESRFKKNPELKALYREFIHEYADLGHLSVLNEPRPANSYFLPHHPVLREKSETTRLRVVFNASEPTTSGISVNDLQMIGPNIQDSLFNILLRFRQYKFVLSGDIEKMYRQVLVKESDRNLQLILWRDNENEPLRTLRLNTVTYGFASASFLSTRCIWELGEQCDNPTIKTIIQKDFYCDDLLTGANNADELRFIQRSVSDELSKGCFPLRKYRSNLDNLLPSNSLTENSSNLLISNSNSTLGIGWSPSTDKINFPINCAPETVCTKRSILSSTFKIFDPLGLLSLCTIKAKIILQQLWADKSYKLDWDTPVPQPILSTWQKINKQLNSLADLQIPRRVLIDNPKYIELHCFCDASQKAYGSCIYIRSLDELGNVEIHLLCAKARVAPIKACSIPRLELCGAYLGAQLSASVLAALRLKIDRQVYWTDSNVVIGWLNSPNQAKTFVANRVAAISELTQTADWRHVPTSQNPADLASRGVNPQDVPNSDLWWHGPAFLKQSESLWPVLPTTKVELPEMKAMPALVAEDTPVAANFDFHKYSKLIKLQRVYATVLRFAHNCKFPKNKQVGTLNVHELDKALTVLLKIAQNESFSKEINCLLKGTPLKAKNPLCSLNPFLDNVGLLRVGGRIDTSSYPYDKKHPILLVANHYLTKLIFESEHVNLLHSGPQHLLASIRQKYWPIGGRRLARDVAKNCLICRRLKGMTMSNIMGNLPSDRVEPDFPFSVVATDFAGPFLITDRKGRGCKITKCYLCIFVCFRYKCLHLEVVSELTKDAFILTLKRFISRRGMPKMIYCDNGRNFVAAAKEIANFLKSNNDPICEFAARRGIEFKFSPAYAPHFNGLAEAGVKSAKFHLYRILGQSHLTFEELTTVFTQIEAILNSRPLCPLSPSPNDLQTLTPAHFLIGRSSTSLPSASLMDVPTHRLDRFQRLEQLKQHFWSRWSSEYVAELQQRTKWKVHCKELKLDDLVIIKEANTPPLCWRLGRVVRLFPGSDGVPRVADISTISGIVRRAINRLCLLPNPEEEEIESLS